MKQKHIDAARETRLWIGQIIIPAIMLSTVIVSANPQIKDKVVEKYTSAKTYVTNKFKKKDIEQ